MRLRKALLYTLVSASVASVCAVRAFAQDLETRPRQATEMAPANDLSSSGSEPVVSSRVADDRMKAGNFLITPRNLSSVSRFENLISAAIDDRLGARYHWGATGPNVFDCSGFVWSAFKSAGIDFERGSARTLWSRFTPATAEERFKFGTLVFFSGLTHVGIVADEHGFYHASRHHGVVYAPFDDYWLSRIDGFRRVPLPSPSSDE